MHRHTLTHTHLLLKLAPSAGSYLYCYLSVVLHTDTEVSLNLHSFRWFSAPIRLFLSIDK